MANLLGFLEFLEYIDNRDCAIDVLIRRVEEECVELLGLKVLEALGNTLTDLIFKFGGEVVGDSVWMLVAR